VTEPAISYRPFAPAADLARLVALYREAECVDRTGEDVGEAALAAQMEYPGHDPARDRYVAESSDLPGALAGFGAIYKPPTGLRADLQLCVHPDLRRRGIGSQLLDWLVARGRALGAGSLGIYVDTRNAGADAYVGARGFVPVAAYTRLHVPGDVIPPEPRWPARYSARRYDPARGFETLLDGFNRCFVGLWGHNPVTAQELREWLPALQVDGVFFAFDAAGQLLGMVRGEQSPRLSAHYGAPVINLDAPGVIPERRGESLHLPLLVTAWQWARTRSPAIVQLESWGDDPSIVRSYEDLGFTPVLQEISYRRDLAATSEQ
jgi:mycothiol synthase